MENKNQPVFPRPKQILTRDEDYHEIPAAFGLTKREYFAAMALQGLLANPASGNDTNALGCCAHDAVRVADFLLQELSTHQP